MKTEKLKKLLPTWEEKDLERLGKRLALEKKYEHGSDLVWSLAYLNFGMSEPYDYKKLEDTIGDIICYENIFGKMTVSEFLEVLQAINTINKESA